MNQDDYQRWRQGQRFAEELQQRLVDMFQWNAVLWEEELQNKTADPRRK